jgi:hypothetical protein
MNVFTSLTLWIVLATIIPGLITIACLLVIINWVFQIPLIDPALFSNWYGFSFAVAIMVITQTLGIVQEKIFKSMKIFSKASNKIEIISINKVLLTKDEEIDSEEEYDHLYYVLSILQNEYDKHGHVQRIAGQFFLTMNNLISYIIGLIVMAALLSIYQYNDRVLIFSIILIVLYFLTFLVMKIRFRTLVKSIWITRKVISKELIKYQCENLKSHANI